MVVQQAHEPCRPIVASGVIGYEITNGHLTQHDALNAVPEITLIAQVESRAALPKKKRRNHGGGQGQYGKRAADASRDLHVLVIFKTHYRFGTPICHVNSRFLLFTRNRGHRAPISG